MASLHSLPQVCPEIIGWTTRIVKNVMIVRACSRRGGGNTIVVSVVKLSFPPKKVSILNTYILGQIFCSRCASNIIKGARFGAEGMVRTCNLCLEKLAKVEEDDDDDRRSVISSATTFPAHQLGHDPFTLRHSPFSAHLFGKSDEPFNLYPISESRGCFHNSDDGFSRPDTPLQMREGKHGPWDTVRMNPAPFRQALSDEEKDSGTPPLGFNNSDSSPKALDAKNNIDFPTKPISIDTSTSCIQFPIGSPENLTTPTRTMAKFRAPNSQYGEFEVATPFIRSRVQSRLDPTLDLDAGWRTRRESTA